MQKIHHKTLQYCLNILYSGTSRACALTNIMMSLANAGHQYKHPVELTLDPYCHYTYSNLSKVVKHFQYTEAILRQFFTAYADPPKRLISGKEYYAFGYDFTKVIKAYSHSLPNRGYLVAANPVAGKLGITAGYVLGALHYLCGEGGFAPMTSFMRIDTQQDKDNIALSQIRSFVADNKKQLEQSVIFLLAMDSAFGKAKILSPLHEHKQLVGLIRLRQGMKVWTVYKGEQKGQGTDRIYGDQYYLFSESKTKKTLRKGVEVTVVQQSIRDLTADEAQAQKRELQNGKSVIITLRRYNNLLIRTKQGNNMKDKPFDLVEVTLQDVDTGEAVFQKPLYIAVTGTLKAEVSTWEAYIEYLRRFDVEKVYRFSNNNLLMSAFQTCEATHLDNWLLITQMAYWLLFVARTDIDQVLCQTWQKYLPNNKAANDPENLATKKCMLTPAQVQKSIGTIFYTFDKSLFLPKVRKNGKGRAKGTKLPKRPKQPIIKKNKKTPKQNPKQLNC